MVGPGCGAAESTQCLCCGAGHLLADKLANGHAALSVQRACSACRTAERVLADADLAWAITGALLAQYGPQPSAAPGCWPLAEWAALSGLNAAFRAALAPQPVCLRLAPGWQKRGVRGGALARLRPRLAALELPPGDAAASEAVLAPAFRRAACQL